MNWFAQYMTTPKQPNLVNSTGAGRSATIKNDQTGEIVRFLNGEVEKT
jgi:hypothetical protein